MTKKYIEIMKQYGLEDDQLFKDTLTMYEEQQRLAKELRADIKKRGTIVEKEYVKGRPNPTANPSIDAYNKTVAAINQTVQTLKKIIEKSPGATKAGEEEDELERILGIHE